MSSRTAGSRAAVLLVLGALLAACGASESPPVRTPTPTVPVPPVSSPPTQLDCAEQTLAGLGLDARIGQLVMLGVDVGSDPASAASAVTEHHLGGVTFIGRSYDGVDAVKQVTRTLQAAADLPLLVATDQEGGQVQVLHGPGFSEMPTALDQGRLAPDDLETKATTWGKQLHQAGITTDLAPVLDVVPASLGTANQPIGRYDREYGYTPSVVTREGLAFARGLQDAHVIPVVKHFPGLGAVHGNTDTTADVVDTVTSDDSASLEPFRQAVDDGFPVVMVSSATYQLIDPDRPAMFSPKVITDLLRGDLGFEGVVISDDLGNAASAKAYGSVSKRAVSFVSAGGDILLTVNADDLDGLAAALAKKAQADPEFSGLVDAAATRVLEAKAAAGLLPCSG